MPTGFQVYNDSGFLQVDQDTFNFTLTNKGTLTLNNTAYGSATIRRGSFSVTATYPVIAIQSSYDTFVNVINTGTNAWTVYVWSLNCPNAGTVAWYLFASANNNATTDNFGLEVFNASGVRVFHSSAKVMRVFGSIVADTTSLALTSGRSYAIAQQSMKNLQTSTDTGIVDPFNGLNDYYTFINSNGSAWISGTTAYCDLIQYENYNNSFRIGTANTSVSSGTNAFLVVDVTNF